MNDLVFNNTAENLQTAFYGLYGAVYKPIAVDSNGYFLFSSLSVITITATNLDIRNLRGTQDSVQVSSMGFVEDNVTMTVPSGTNFVLTENISLYSENSFFIRNTGPATVTVTLQVAPLDNPSYYVGNSTAQGVASSTNTINAVTLPMKFARLQVVASTNTGVIVYYNGRA